MRLLRIGLLALVGFCLWGCADDGPPEPVDPNNLTKKYVVYDFGATWCEACKQFAPTFDEWKTKYSGSCVTFQKVDVQEKRELAVKFHIEALPTILVTADGKEVRRFVGRTSERALTKLLK